MPIDYLAVRPQCVVDTECYPNLWVLGAKSMETGKRVIIAQHEGLELDRKRIAQVLRYHRFYTFNGINYDMCMIMLAMQGATCYELKKANDEIIPPKGSGIQGLKHWEFFERYNLSMPDWMDHIDLMEVAPAAAQRAGLKKYAGMMHSRTMRDLPYAVDAWLEPPQIEQVLLYLENDLDVTHELASELQPQIAIRAKISVKLGVDVRSKSDAQVGEAIMRKRVEKRIGKKLYRPDIRPGPFKFDPPAYVRFETPLLQDMFTKLRRADFVVRGDGYVQLPELFGAKKKKDAEIVADEDELEGGAEIAIGANVYKMGIGGLHSQEKAISHYEDDEFILADNDVTGYYPNLIIRSGREPDNMRGHFTHEYKGIVDERTAAKIAGRKDEDQAGKIASNGLFGKTGSPYSIVYAPRMLIQTTVSGQLSILMLIEACEMHGWSVISANTDGFVTRVPRAEYGAFRCVIFDWEMQTGLRMEETFYRSLHSISVNSYVAFKKNQDKKTGAFTGEIDVKRKGDFTLSGRGHPAAAGLKKTPKVEICYDAAVAYLLNGTPVEQTITECTDIRKFVSVRAVKGGARKDDEIIGKVVRYYYADDVTGPLLYIESGNKVPRSEGAEPCMTLPDEFPRNVDNEWYEREAYAILDDMGVDVIDPTVRGRTGKFFGRLDDQKTIHKVDASTGLALCGLKRKSRRDQWVEFASQPETERYCAKCRRMESL